MAARRLIVVMLTLLVISSVAAALVPVDRDRLEDSSTETTTTAPPAPRGELVREAIRADARRPARVEIKLGDQLVLRVTSTRPGEVEIPRLGELADVDPDAPARFDLLPSEPGTFRVRFIELAPTVDRTRTIGRIEVSPRGESGKRKRARRDQKS